jgi:hypothetical protein
MPDQCSLMKAANTRLHQLGDIVVDYAAFLRVLYDITPYGRINVARIFLLIAVAITVSGCAGS